MNSVVSQELFDYALMRPLSSAAKPDRLRIVSGYATNAMASHHLLQWKALGKRIDIDLVYGMAGVEGVSKVNHNGFVTLEKHDEFEYSGSFQCSYVKRPLSVHSKVYVWCKGDAPVLAFIGSANYSMQGFTIPTRTETLAECDPATALDFFQDIKQKSVRCSRIKSLRDFSQDGRRYDLPEKIAPVLTIETDPASPYKGRLKVSVPLVNTKGHLGDNSGLNWGVSSDGKPRETGGSKRNPDEAYIRIPKKIADSGFFPAFNTEAKRKNEQIRFTVGTDDNASFSCVRASGDYGKEIETPQDNSELGRYFRKRLGLPSGAYITVADLKRYGRLDVIFYKLDDENYVMDFSKPSGKVA